MYLMNEQAMSKTTAVDENIIPIIIDYLEQDQVYRVSCPWLQGCHAWGETLDETVRAIPGNIRAMIAARRDNGSPLHPELKKVDLVHSFTLRMATT